MDLLIQFGNIVLHLDKYLQVTIENWGFLTYGFLFLIIFAETGFVITPILPGDSLLFATGAISSLGALNILIVWIILSSAAILGDTINYWIGHFIGPKAFQSRTRFLNQKHLIRAHNFYEKHGGKVIILARFIPIIRTFAPFVAGIGKMNYFKFLTYNVIGGLVWISLLTLGGYYFGNIPLVKRNFSYVILVIIIISLIPILVDLGRNFKKNSGY